MKAKMRTLGVTCLAATAGLVTAGSLVLSAPAHGAGPCVSGGSVVLPNGTSVTVPAGCAPIGGVAVDGSVVSGEGIAIHGSTASGCSIAADQSTASGGTCAPAAKAAPAATPARAVAANPSFAG